VGQCQPSTTRLTPVESESAAASGMTMPSGAIPWWANRYALVTTTAVASVVCPLGYAGSVLPRSSAAMGRGRRYTSFTA
jgi:hypothetical protein